MIVNSNIEMKEYSNMKIGGIAKELIFVENKEELVEIYNTRDRIYLIGNGTNTLINDEYLEKINVQKLREKMLEKGILIRDASNFVYLDNKYFRLAVKDRKNNIRVLEALKEIFENIKREKREKDK